MKILDYLFNNIDQDSDRFDSCITKDINYSS